MMGFDDKMMEGLEGTRRQHMRFKLNAPLFAHLSLCRVKERDIESRAQRVMLNNISVGGCQFTTNLLIPVRDDVEWKLRLQLGHYWVKLKAVVVHYAEAEGLYHYGVRWKINGLERQALQYRLNEYLRLIFVSSPHIHSLYKKLANRNCDGQFKPFDATS